MPYVFNTPTDVREMLKAIGAGSIDDLFDAIPAELRLNRSLELAPAQSELELTEHMQTLGSRNASTRSMTCFLGGGSYDHFVPAVVDELASRGEIYTAYTPYQPEASQGTLQSVFEYQTLITRLTGMDVSNASLYDGATAATEAVLMALSVQRQRRRVVVLESVHPEYRATLATYLAQIDAELITVPTPAGRVDPEQLARVMDAKTACLLIQTPNFFGSLESAESLVQTAHDSGALAVVAVDPVSLGLLKRPGDYGADIVVAEGQSLGNHLAYGGPYLGIMATKEAFVRRMPGRITGQTTDRRGNTCWVLTLQTREQHIRREKATSNICTNQGLLAFRATVHLALLGPHGLRELAERCTQKAHYAAAHATASTPWQLAFDAPFFKEFVLRDPSGDVRRRLKEAEQAGILAGIPLGNWYEDLDDAVLVAVTEKRSRAEIDRWASALTGIAESDRAHTQTDEFVRTE